MTLLAGVESLKKTALYDQHVLLGGKMVNFNGWALPVYYSGILQEHEWTRRSCCVFDVSHLGEIRVKGKAAFSFLQHRLTNDLQKLPDGRMQYHLLCDESGGVIDDVLVYRESADDFYLVVNASNIAADFEALSECAPSGLEIRDQSDQTGCVAVQGPKAETILTKIFGFNLKNMEYYAFQSEKFLGEPLWISRSGYTGEDGFEIFSSHDLVREIWDKLIHEGKTEGALPAGLGARNTLRLEAGNALYGNDMNRTTSALEAGLGFAVSFTKEGGFVGREWLLAEKQRGSKKKLIAFRVLDKPVAREHYPIFKEGKKVGEVTSGSFGPTVGASIGLGYVEAGLESAGTRIEIEIYGRMIPAEVVKRPFVEMRHKR